MKLLIVFVVILVVVVGDDTWIKLTCMFNHTYCLFRPDKSWSTSQTNRTFFYAYTSNPNEVGGTIASLPLMNEGPYCFSFKYNFVVHDWPVYLTVEVGDDLLLNKSSKDAEGWRDGQVTMPTGSGQVLTVRAAASKPTIWTEVQVADFVGRPGSCP